MKNVLVSVIVAVYNVELYLRECTESIINQSYSNLEIILVDDGSTDNSSKLCDEYEKIDKRIVALHKKNGGLSSARNAGIDIARGQYICFVDGDDWLEPCYIECFIDKASPGSIVCCGYNLQYKRKTISNIPTQIELNFNNFIDRLFSSALDVYTNNGLEFIGNYAWNKIYPRDFFKSIRYPEGLNFEDIYISIDILKLSKSIKIIPFANYNYRMRDNSIVHIKSKTNYLDNIKARLKQENDIKEFPNLFQKARIITFFNTMFLAIESIKQNVSLNYNEKNMIKNLIQDRIYDVPIIYWKMYIKAFMYLYCPKLLKKTLMFKDGCNKNNNHE